MICKDETETCTLAVIRLAFHIRHGPPVSSEHACEPAGSVRTLVDPSHVTLESVSAVVAVAW